MSHNNAPLNKILAAVPSDSLDRVFEKLESVPLEFGEHLHWAGHPIEHMSFPESGIVSLIASAHDSSFVEVGMIGNEGVAGFPVALGVNISAGSSVVQGGGTAHRISAIDYTALSDSIPELRNATLRFIHGLMAQTGLAAACNAFHPADRRLARWLLMMHDRMHEDEFHLTQEFLAQMLGVRREAVNKYVGELREAGHIEAGRSRITILNRPGLQNMACACYREIASAFQPPD